MWSNVNILQNIKNRVSSNLITLYCICYEHFNNSMNRVVWRISSVKYRCTSGSRMNVGLWKYKTGWWESVQLKSYNFKLFKGSVFIDPSRRSVSSQGKVVHAETGIDILFKEEVSPRTGGPEAHLPNRTCSSLLVFLCVLQFRGFCQFRQEDDLNQPNLVRRSF